MVAKVHCISHVNSSGDFMQKSYDTSRNCSENQFSLYVLDFSLIVRSNMIDI